MEHVIFNAETGETIVVPFTPEEEAAFAVRTTEIAAQQPTVEELQAQLAVIAAQLAALTGAK
jgi:hypothetical protein